MFLAGGAVVTAMIVGLWREPSPNTKFIGWTNIAGETFALAEVGPVPEVRYKNFFCFQFYQVKVDYLYLDVDGVTNTGSYVARDFTGMFTNRLVVATPVPTNAISFQYVSMTPRLARGWDNVSPPFRAPDVEFRVKAPMISAEQLALLRRD
jgi:hypothetical protein